MRTRIAVVLILLLVAGAAVYLWSRLDSGPGSGDPRYDEIADLIDDNLHFGRHFTWAVTGETISEMRRHVTAADIPILIRMLGDERGTNVVTAGALLAILGDAARPALERAAQSSEWRAAMEARDALSRIDQCANNPAGTNPAFCP